ncbi:MAG: hypothetical protein ACE37I_03880 [Rubinisphaera brasiliensis]|uniref:hypothetical protein n=1 Tax=Rubinisphaera brasiliensis TaxID=119 RepID=UPI003919CA66
MRICFLLSLAAVLTAAVGCGGSVAGPELANVSGTVTVNGDPVEGLIVEFQPADGPPASGVTDGSGNYTLTATGGRSGAQLGLNQVRVKGRPADTSEEVLSEMATEEGTDLEALKSLPVIPPKYNEESELEADVQPGSNEFDFPLEI